MHSPRTASGARYRRSASIDMDNNVDACGSGLLRHGLNFSAAWLLCDWSVSKKTGCINAKGGHSEHLLWHCLPDIPVATHHSRFYLGTTDDNPQVAFFRASNIWQNATNLQSDEKVHKLVWWHFQRGGQMDYSLFSCCLLYTSPSPRD